jgi:hypothetical protein
MFPALVRIANPGHALMPGMNAEVEVHIGRRDDVLAIPYAALRTQRDAPSAAAVLGLDPAVLDSLRVSRPDGAGRSAGGRRNSYIVFRLRSGGPGPVMVRTGLTDLDYVEVLDGLSESDTVIVLPSASLVASQEQMRERIERVTGGGLPGVQQQTQRDQTQTQSNDATRR